MIRALHLGGKSLFTYLEMLLDIIADLRGKSDLLEVLGRHFEQLVQVGNVLVNGKAYSHFLSRSISLCLNNFNR